MILDLLFLRVLNLLKKFDILGLFILTGFAQIFGFPTEVSIPIAGMIFGLNPIAVIIAALGDAIAAFLLIYAGKSLKIISKRELKVFSTKEIIFLRFIPIVRGSILPLISDVEKKKLFPIIMVTSFLWAIILISLGSYLNAYKVSSFIKNNEHYFLILLGIVFVYKGVTYYTKILKNC